MKTTPPLPDLEQELVNAARRLEGAAPRRRRLRHGWALLSLVLVATGGSVAVARVVHVGPFSYLDNYTGGNPKLASTSSVTLQPAGDQPAWQVRALVNRLGELCMTGGPRDPRKDPLAPPTGTSPNNPPQAGMLCTDSDELAQQLVDPTWPGATFANSTNLDGNLGGMVGRITRSGHFVTVKQPPTTKMLVYGVAEAGVTPVVQWGPHGTPIAMTAASRHLSLAVDKSPEGLTPTGRKEVASYPGRLDLVLWAAEVPVPPGTGPAQVAYPGEMPPLGVPDDTIDMVSQTELTRIVKVGQAHGWKYVRHIVRDPVPPKGASKHERQWVGAFARPHTSRDTAPRSLHTNQTGFERIQWDQTRRATIVGGGIPDPAWIVPGGLPVDEPWSGPLDQLCFVGAPLLTFGGNHCVNDLSRWHVPYVQAVACSPSLTAAGDTLMWGLTPPGATGVVVTGPGTTRRTFPAADIVAIRTRVAAEPTSVTWTFAAGKKPVTVRVPWPHTTPRCGDRPPAWKVLRPDSEGTGISAGGPHVPLLPRHAAKGK